MTTNEQKIEALESLLIPGGCLCTIRESCEVCGFNQKIREKIAKLSPPVDPRFYGATISIPKSELADDEKTALLNKTVKGLLS